MKIFNYSKGKINESKAVQYVLKHKKYKILETNYTTKIGEIDIIALDKSKTIIFIEVKYRSTPRYGHGREAVDNRKIVKIRNVATQYLLESKNMERKVRFDVIDILDDDLTYIENAF